MDENRIPFVIDTVRCGRHSAERQSPCWWVWPMSGRRKMPAICNNRATQAGLIGPIDPRSLRTR